MRLHRFIGKFDLARNELSINDKDFINQLKNVLRLGVGDKIILCDGESNEVIAEIVNLNKEFAELKFLESYKNETEPKNFAHLYCPILKKENFEWAIQKAVEIGVKEITPIITTRTVKLGLNYERLNKIIKEASEQSGRGVLPKLNEAVDFNEAIAEAKNKNEINLFFNIGESLFKNQTFKFKKIGIFIGPEGGWTEEEIKNAQSAGFAFAGLGKTTLRAETAVIVASYLVVNLC